MKKTAIAAMLWLAVASPVIAAEGTPPAQGADPNFDQRKATILKMLDARIANMQLLKSCVDKTKSQEDIKTCMQNNSARMQQRRPGGPGQGGPDGPKTP
ncbi:MAG TPA: hypothetical protein VLY20_05775 [Nitrospiria bacterium]|nr:hypothetical protein [Nitrospiria bacterium]